MLRIFIDTAGDATSHNLWPFEILMVVAAGTLFMIALPVDRKVTKVGCPDRGAQPR